MGTASFSDSYAGQFMTPSGRLIVYLARSGSSVFVSELHQFAQTAHNGPDNYTLVTVRHSWAQLVSVTSRITSDMRSLQAQGVELAQWGPDPQSNRVTIIQESYSEQAVHTLLHRYGSQWISVSHATERWVLTDPGGAAMPHLNGETRLTDTAPFFAGDIQWYGSQSSSRACTSSFNFVAKKSGNRFGLASGHCASNAGGAAGTVVYTNTKNRQTVGRISVQYFPGSKIDVASVNTGGFSANVYGNGTTTYTVVGATFPGPGDLVTADGRVSGEVLSVKIENTGNTINVQGFPIIDLTVASKKGATVCQPGDSGGPWYVHIGETDEVSAAGQQVAEREDPNGKLDPSVCAYQQINNILTLVNGTILAA
jgi:hypothetical protein